MKNIVIIFGGKSVEHDISILTGLHAARNVVEGRKIHLVYLTRDNTMVEGGRDLKTYISGASKRKPVFFQNGCLHIKKWWGLKKVCKVDVLLNCCHGGAGEGGELSAFFKLNNIPISCSDMITSAILMSKSRTREMLDKCQGFLQPKYMKFDDIRAFDAEKVVKSLELPLVVKPDKLGSSIGITRVSTVQELDYAARLAFSLDDTVIVEEFIDFDKEINCAAFEYRGQIITSKCETTKQGENQQIFDFSEKYLDGPSGFTSKKLKPEEEEEDTELCERISSLTRRAYELFGCRGVVRMDFLVKGGKIYLNEVNTVPGFMAYHLFVLAGIQYGTLLEMIIDEAIREHSNQPAKKTEYKSDVLQVNRRLVE